MECRIHKLVADVAILSEGRVALVRYRDTKPYDGQRGWFLPDDYLAHLEHPRDAATRIAHDQVDLEVDDVRLDHVESFGNGAWHLVFHHVVRLESAPELRAGENVLAAEWFGLRALPSKSEFAHEGWALDVLETIGARP